MLQYLPGILILCVLAYAVVRAVLYKIEQDM